MTRKNRETPTHKMWGRGFRGTGTGWPGIPQGYPWYSLAASEMGIMLALLLLFTSHCSGGGMLTMYSFVNIH